MESHRVFSVNVESGAVEEALKFEQPYAYAFSYDWLDENNLLIGFSRGDYLNFQSYLKGGIKSYDAQSGIQTGTVELLGFQGSQIKWNPEGATFVAFTSEPLFDLSENGQLSVSGSTLLGTYFDGDLTIFSESYKLPYGVCANPTAMWSPDGQYFAFLSTGERQNCHQDENKSNVYVYSYENMTTTNLTDSLTGNVDVLGWSIIQK